MRFARVATAIAALFVLAAVPAEASSSMTLAWDPSSDPSVVGYVVMYGTASGSYTFRVDVGNKTQASVAGLNEGAKYFFAVAAYDGNGLFSAPSAEVNGLAPISGPLMSIDTPSASTSVTGKFGIAGWAIDRGATSTPGVDVLHVYAYPTSGGAPQFLAQLATGNARPDVGSIFGSQFSTSGYSGMLTLNPGTYDVVVYAHSTVTNTFNNVKAVRVTSAAPVSKPVISIDTPGAGNVTRPFMIAGWSADFASPAGGGPGIDAVHVWAYPNPGSGQAAIWLGSATLGGVRSDVGSIFGPQFTNSGYALVVGSLPLGVYRIVTYAHSTISGTFGAAASVDVTVK